MNTEVKTAHDDGVNGQPVNRRLSAEAVALLILLPLVVIVAAFGFGLWRNDARISGLTRISADALVERVDDLLETQTPINSWNGRLASGRISPGYYLLRVFTSLDYLVSQAGDRDFLADATLVLTGMAAEDGELDAAEQQLVRSGSRLEALNSLLAGAGQQPVRLPGEPTRLRTFTLADKLPAAGSDLVGLVTFEVEARLTGSNARFRVFSDSRLRQSQGVADSDPTVSNNYFIEWDTRMETPGSRHVALLVQTADGRGLWMDLQNYTIPVITPLSSGWPLEFLLVTGRSSWFSLPVTEEGSALLTLIDASAPLESVLFDIHANELATTVVLAGQPAALRSRVEDSRTQESGVCYVRMNHGEDNPLSVKLVPALAAARAVGSPDQLFGVLAIQEDQLLVQGLDGVIEWQSTEQYRLINPTGRLSRLELRWPDGSQAELAGRFDPESLRYGLVVEEDTNYLVLSTRTMEGSAAQIQIERITEDGEITTLSNEQPVLLEQSENRLQIQVTGFDDVIRTYEINILRPPHSGGFHLTLQNFPGSYRTPLWFMHLNQPAWQFQAFNPGIEWSDFITAQTERDKSLVSSPPSPASWVRSGSPVYDGAAWKAAATPVVEYFGDPRNFLNEIDIFQFEKMVYDPAIHTINGLNAIFGNSFMASGNPAGIDYGSIVLTAGETANISPYFLAAKIIQEMGYNGESTLAHGTLPGFEGYYNFYNIGSTPNPSVPDGARINGARFAQYGRRPDEMEITEEEEAWLLPWTNPERAIVGGAIWIAQLYINIGQDTLYLQKFDLIEDGGYFTRQYAQNIQMAWSEGRNTRRAYTSTGLLDQPFVFEIPVFSNMPDRPQTLP